MTRRLILVASLPEVDQRNLILPGGRDLEPADWLGGTEVRHAADARWCGSDHGAHATAVVLGADAEPLDAVAARSLGDWAGRSLIELADEDPEAVGLFPADLDFAPPAGESHADVIGRVGRWMQGLESADLGRVIVVVDPAVVRAAVAVALEAPLAMLRVDIEPLTTTTLTHHASTWRVRAIGSISSTIDG